VHLGNAMLVAVTEMNTREQIDHFVKALAQIPVRKLKSKKAR
jgi:glycine cleavage system protein P-like pyridoxal-binding family